MFCMNCGTKLPDDAKFCYKCGTQLGITQNIKKEDSKKQSNSPQSTVIKTFEFGEGLHINFYAEDMDYCKLRKDIELNIAEKQVEFYMEYKEEKISDMDDVLQKAIPLANSIIDDSIDFGVSLLMKWGIDFIDKEQLEKVVMEKAQELPAGKIYQQETQRLVQYAAQLQEEHASKDYWSGGGFGISGAIEGAVKAGIMNMGTNALVNLGRSISGNTVSKKMSRLKAELYTETDQEQLFLDLIYESGCIALFDTLYKILLDNKLISPAVHYDQSKALGKYKNIYAALANKKMSGEQSLKPLCSCIGLNPFWITPTLVLSNYNHACFTTALNMMEFLGMSSRFALSYRRNILSEYKNVLKELSSTLDLDEINAMVIFSQDDLACIETLYQPLNTKLTLYFINGKFTLNTTWENIDCFTVANNPQDCEITVYTDKKPNYKNNPRLLIFEDQKIRISKNIKILFTGEYADELKAKEQQAELDREKGILNANIIQLTAEKLNLEFYSFRIPDTYTQIAQKTFKGYEQLRKISLPQSINSIENEAFSNCPSLRDLECLNKKCQLGTQLFNGSPNIIVHCVADGSMHEYCYMNHVPFWIGEKNPYLVSNYKLITRQKNIIEYDRLYDFRLDEDTIQYRVWHDRGEYTNTLLENFNFSTHEIEKIEKQNRNKIVFHLTNVRGKNKAECYFVDENIPDLIKFLYYVAQSNIDIYEAIDKLAHKIDNKEAESCLKNLSLHKQETLAKQLPPSKVLKKQQLQNKSIQGEESFKAEKYTEALPLLQKEYDQKGIRGGKAALYLGIMYAKGLGVLIDASRAEVLFDTAIEWGNADTKRIANDWKVSLKENSSEHSMEHNDSLLGEEAFASGKYADALLLLQKDYAQGGIRGGKAALYIGIMCAKGLGVQVSIPNAKAWFNIALDLGDNDTKRIAKDWMSTL